MVSQELTGDPQQAEPGSIVYQNIYIHIYQIIMLSTLWTRSSLWLPERKHERLPDAVIAV